MSLSISSGVGYEMSDQAKRDNCKNSEPQTTTKGSTEIDNTAMEIPTRLDDGFAMWAAKDRPFKAGNTEGEERSEFKHDGDEVVYSAAFRRLSDKSQVIVKPERIEHFRSRLTHTLEVNQIAESIGIPLRLNIPLINAIAFGHDIGHAPFGHAGERQFQEILRSDVLSLCDFKVLQNALKEEYGIEETIERTDTGELKNPYWLFHHAINSVRIVQRKFKEVTDETIFGILSHSWSPWRPKYKFGIPRTYEAQAVAISDQIAGINHDTEDILNCEESTYKPSNIPDRFYDEVPTYIAKKGFLTYEKAEQILETQFLKKGDSQRKNGWGRKYRLRDIINSVVEKSKDKLLKNSVNSAYMASKIHLELDQHISAFLRGYEDFIRENIIGKIPWFKQRDAQAAAGIWAVYKFYKHYGSFDVDFKYIKTTELRAKMENAVANFKKSVSEETYVNDKHCHIFIKSALKGKEREIEDVIKTVDYVSGMTDRHLMQIYDIAFNLFR